MGMNSIHPVGLSAPAISGTTSAESGAMDREIVAAVRSANKSELLGQDRELTYRREPKTGRMVIQIVERSTGDVVDQIPPEVLLELRESLAQEVEGEASHK